MSKVKAGVALASTSTGTLKSMPQEMKVTLDGKTLNDAINGNLFGYYDANPDAAYAVVNGCAVPCSSTVNSKESDELQAFLGDLTFGSGISPETLNGKHNPQAGKAWFRLGMPKGIRGTADESINIAKAFAEA